MARFRNARSPINSVKHILDVEGVLTGGIGSQSTLAIGVPNVDAAVFKPGDIRTGGTINGMFLSVFVIGASGAALIGAIDWLLCKTHEGQTAPTPGQTGTSM